MAKGKAVKKNFKAKVIGKGRLVRKPKREGPQKTKGSRYA